MQKISKDEFSKLSFVENTRRIAMPKAIEALRELSVDEGLIVKKEEWDRKSDISAYISSFFRKNGNKRFSLRTLADKSAWAIMRIQ